ncbi:MAG: hypothetical protein ACOYMA_13600 [Bacteroidia bacterium]
MQIKKNWFMIEINQSETEELEMYLSTIYHGNKYTEYSFDLCKSKENKYPKVEYYITANGTTLHDFISKRFNIMSCEIPDPELLGSYMSFK